MNLLPRESKKEIATEYHKRLIVVSLLMMLALALASLVPFIVYYVTSSYQLAGLKNELNIEIKNNSIDGITDQITLINDVNKKSSILLENTGNSLVGDDSRLFLKVVEAAEGIHNVSMKSAIHLNMLSRGQRTIKKGGQATVEYLLTMSGTANTRADLLAFIKVLQSDKDFLAVDLQIGNLVEGVDAKFFVTITLKKNS